MKHSHSKSFYVFAAMATVVTCALFAWAYLWLYEREIPKTQFGITYSWTYARQLGLDPLESYERMIDELGVKQVRLPVYWSEVQRTAGQYDWSVTDELLEISQERGVDITLVVGMKVPRWPECYVPDWAKGFDEAQQHLLALRFIEETVNRYRDVSAISRWQVENEPFFPYGECPSIDVTQFRERVDLVRSLDERPIQVTVSGELGPWRDAAQAADILGISMYRQTWNDVFGYFIYPLTPAYYFFRAQLVQDDVSQVIISELQAEPWFSDTIQSRPFADWYESFTSEMLEQNVSFAREVGVAEAYLWGAEWWYALKQVGEDRLWETAKHIFTTP